MIGDVRIIYPPNGTDTIIAQGHLITASGTRLQIDDSLYRLHMAGMIRISDQTAPPLPKITKEIEETKETGDDTVKGVLGSPPDTSKPEAISSPTSSGEVPTPSSFSGVSEEGSEIPPSSRLTRAEIETYYSYGQRLPLRHYQKSFTGLVNSNKSTEELRDLCLQYASD